MSFLRRIASAVVLASTLAVLPVSHAQAAEPQAPVASVEVQKRQILDGVNALHAQRGLPALTVDPAIESLAQGWADELARLEGIKHNPDLMPRIAAAGYSSAGEVIAGNGRDGVDGTTAVGQWTNSPHHLEILTSPKYQTMGVGIATYSYPLPNGAVVTDVIWVVDLGGGVAQDLSHWGLPPVTTPTPAPVLPPSATPHVKRHGRSVSVR